MHLAVGIHYSPHSVHMLQEGKKKNNKKTNNKYVSLSCSKIVEFNLLTTVAGRTVCLGFLESELRSF